jgi:hypothetical protein
MLNSTDHFAIDIHTTNIHHTLQMYTKTSSITNAARRVHRAVVEELPHEIFCPESDLRAKIIPALITAISDASTQVNASLNNDPPLPTTVQQQDPRPQLTEAPATSHNSAVSPRLEMPGGDLSPV